MVLRQPDKMAFFQAMLSTVIIAVFSVIIISLRNIFTHEKMITHEMPLPATSPHQIPFIPMLRVKANIAAKRGVIMVLRIVAVRASIPCPAPWKIHEDSIPNPTVGS